MKVLILTGSPRKRGNSNHLAEQFAKGAKEAGHEIFIFDCAKQNVNGCIACDKCGMNGDCVQRDDFDILRPHLLSSDMIVFASPIYYFGISAQLKTTIDRFYAINTPLMKSKKCVLLITYANGADYVAEPTIVHYKAMVNYLDWSEAGQVIAKGVWGIEDAAKSRYSLEAYELGKQL